MTLYQSLIRANRFDLVLEKGTEIGVSRFIPVAAARSIIQGNGEASPARSQRWSRLVMEAAEQCGRGRLPRIDPPIALEDAVRGAQGLKLVPYEDERGLRLSVHLKALRERPRVVSLLIGPEGGFELSEIGLARENGWTSVSLGPRLMRSETAGIVASALAVDALG